MLEIWKHYDVTEIFKGLSIPDNWDTLEEFVDWYMSAKIPLMVPWNAEVIRSDDATAICLFKKGQYQVELYLEFPRMSIVKHSHPRMEVIVVDIGGGGLHPKAENNTSKIWGRAHKKLMPGNAHGGDTSTVLGKGFVTLAFEKWENAEEMSSAAVQWTGGLQGPIQEELIKRKKQTAIVTSNYADVTQDQSLNKD